VNQWLRTPEEDLFDGHGTLRGEPLGWVNIHGGCVQDKRPHKHVASLLGDQLPWCTVSDDDDDIAWAYLRPSPLLFIIRGKIPNPIDLSNGDRWVIGLDPEGNLVRGRIPAGEDLPEGSPGRQLAEDEEDEDD
jgi:hypothetical protein